MSDQGVCIVCNGSGWVGGLPDLRELSMGQWIGRPFSGKTLFSTVAVLCDCDRGSKRREKLPDEVHHGNGKTTTRENVLALYRYETLNPNWREQVAQVEADRVAKVEAERMEEARKEEEKQQAARAAVERVQEWAKRNNLPLKPEPAPPPKPVPVPKPVPPPRPAPQVPPRPAASLAPISDAEECPV